MEFSVPFPLDRILGRALLTRRSLSRMLQRQMERQPADEAARVVHALRLADPDLGADQLVELANRALRLPVSTIATVGDIPRPGSRELHLVLDALADGNVQIAYRTAKRKVESTIIDRDGRASGVGYMEFGELS